MLLRASLFLNLALAVVAALLWLTRPEIGEPQVRTEYITETRVDTFWAEPETPRDIATTPVSEEVVEQPAQVVTSGEEADSIEVPTYDVEGPETIELEYPVRRYVRGFDDERIQGELEIFVEGRLQTVNMKYTLKKIPIQIRETVDNTKTITETIHVYRSFFQVGAHFGTVNESMRVTPMLAYTHKSGRAVIYRYDPKYASHSIGILVPIKLSWF